VRNAVFNAVVFNQHFTIVAQAQVNDNIIRAPDVVITDIHQQIVIIRQITNRQRFQLPISELHCCMHLHDLAAQWPIVR
jgi:LEA14-like dessication related protein